MRYQPVSALPLMNEDTATGEVAQIFAEIRREMGLPYIPNAAKALAVSPFALRMFCDITRSYSHTTLPQSLISMILFTIAKTGDCKYCSATNELSCRTLGVDKISFWRPLSKTCQLYAAARTSDHRVCCQGCT